MTDEEILSGDWEKFETWIREQVGGNFVWKIRPLDIKANRQAVMESILRTIKENDGIFPPKGDTFIELTSKKG
ncbi:MAG: hypothetical protein KAQ81_08305 [Deltaproteobacteria bacterium]|nr:hypothetical protein [Deltaproteobacteria bacterium]